MIELRDKGDLFILKEKEKQVEQVEECQIWEKIMINCPNQVHTALLEAKFFLYACVSKHGIVAFSSLP